MRKCASHETAVLGWPGLGFKWTLQHRVNKKTCKACKALSDREQPGNIKRRPSQGKSGVTEAASESQTPGRGRVRTEADGRRGHQELEEAGRTCRRPSRHRGPRTPGLWASGCRAVRRISVRSVKARVCGASSRPPQDTRASGSSPGLPTPPALRTSSRKTGVCSARGTEAVCPLHG